MRQGPGSRRPRSRGNGKRHPSNKNQNFESNGPDVKVRGSAHQVLEKYLALARDAASSGDRIAAEGYFQHAEHYHRLAISDGGGNGQGRGGNKAPPPPVSDALPGDTPPINIASQGGGKKPVQENTDQPGEAAEEPSADPKTEPASA